MLLHGISPGSVICRHYDTDFKEWVPVVGGLQQFLSY